MSRARGAIVRLLSVMRDGKEIRQYLQRFAELDRARFAVIKVGGAVVRDELETLAEALAFLHTVGLTPVVVHGAGPQLDAAVADAGLPVDKVDGRRVTDAAVLSLARTVFTRVNLEIADAIRSAGARAAAIPMGVFDAVPAADTRLGFVGEPTAARVEVVESAARAGAIPILSSLGVDTQTGQLLNINADAAVRVLVTRLEPYKIVFLTGTGAVLDGEGAPISAINLATDLEDLQAQPWFHGGMQLKVEEIARLLADLPASTSVSITKPSALAQELFTHGGAGTLVRQGETINAYSNKADVDAARLERLVCDAFGRAPLRDWWDGVALAEALISDQYRAAAVVTQLEDQVGYLDKFAVGNAARGEGLGQAVWRQLRERWPALVWRARPDNPVGDFYARQCEGMVKVGAWTVYWTGLGDVYAAAPLIARAAAFPATLEPAA